MSSFNIKNDLTWRDFLIRTALIVATTAIIVWLMPRKTQTSFNIEKGKPWAYNELDAPFDFPIYESDEAVKAERDSLMKHYEPYYIYNEEIVGKQIRQFSVFDSSTDLNVADLRAGVYMLHVQDATGASTTVKLIKK